MLALSAGAAACLGLLAAIYADRSSETFAEWTAAHPVPVNGAFLIATLFVTYAVVEKILSRRDQQAARWVTGWALRDFVNGIAVPLTELKEPHEPTGNEAKEIRLALENVFESLLRWQPALTATPPHGELFGRALELHQVLGNLSWRKVTPGSAEDHNSPHGYRQTWSWARRELEAIVKDARPFSAYAEDLDEFLSKASFNPVWYDKSARPSPFFNQA